MDNITATNRMIAQFMGGKYISTDRNLILIPRIGVRYITSLRYHYSIDWLLPVWNKIIAETDRGREFEPIYNKFHTSLDSGNINGCYEAITSFLTQQKTSTSS